MGDTKVPMVPPEDYPCYVKQEYICDAERSSRSSNKKFVIIVGVLMAASMTIMMAFTFQSLYEIRQLKEEIEILKEQEYANEIFRHLQEEIDELRLSVHPDANISTEDQYGDLAEDRNDLAETDATDDYDNYYDYENYSELDDDNDLIIREEDTGRLLVADQFTKDWKGPNGLERNRRSAIDSGAEVKGPNVTLRLRHRPTTSPPLPYSPQESAPGGSESEGAVWDATTSRPAHGRSPKKYRAKKSGEPHSSGEGSDAEFVSVRDTQTPKWPRRRHGNLEALDESYPRTGRIKPLPAAHFNGDTSTYVMGQHANFKGNGHLKHSQRTYVDWVEAGWFRTLGMDRHFSLSEGVVTVKESGLYFVYAQIYYLDVHDTNGFGLYKNDDTLIQCTTMTHTQHEVWKGNTCYTAAADYLHEGDRIYLRDLSASRYSIFEPGKSFFGFIKLGDVKIK